MITMKEFDYAKLVDIRIPVPDTLAQSLLDFVVGEKLWPDNIFRLHQRIRDYKANVREAQATFTPQQPPVPIEPEGWVRKAVAMRASGKSWRAIQADVKKPLTTVRRVVAEAMQPAGAP